jgi:hypothetical protein
MKVICKLSNQQLQHKELANKKYQQYFHSTYNKKDSMLKKMTTISFSLVATLLTHSKYINDHQSNVPLWLQMTFKNHIMVAIPLLQPHHKFKNA